MRTCFVFGELSAIFLLAPTAAEDCVKGVELPADFDGSAWPEMWRLISDDPSDPLAPNMGETVDPKVLAAAGVKYMALDPDIITVTAIVESFWEEHHQEHETICWALGGAGYFDIHDVNDEWVRLHMKKGDFFTWPAGINHRFSVDSNSSMQAMHLFKGSPIWTAYPRDEVFGNHTARNDYVDTYLCGKDPDLAAADDGSMDTSSAISMFGIVSKIALTLSLAISSLV